MARDFRTDIEGYNEILREIEVCRKYGTDYRRDPGRWREAVERLHPRRLRLRVSEIIPETGKAATLRLVADKGFLPPFQAGQYITLFVEIDGIRTSRAYSISSSPCQIAYYDITVKQVPGGFVSDYLLNKVRVGDVLESSGPAGHFHYNPLFHGQNLVFLAGGSGITPFMSMIRETTDRGLSRRIHLIYGCLTPDEAIFHRELVERSERHPNFTYHLVISEPDPGYQGLTGFITADLIKNLTGDPGDKMFYLCGPPEMYDFCLAELEKLRVPRRRIRMESFGPPVRVFEDPAWPRDVSPDAVFTVRLPGGREIKAPAREPLLNSLERAGLVVESCCRSGECSMCRVKVQSGRVFQLPGALVRKSDREAGYIHSCVSYPLSDLELML